MRKIKKFKVAVHLKEILRRVKLANIDTAAAGFSTDKDLAVFIAGLHGALQPGVVYEFIEGSCMELSAAGVAHNDMFSVCVLTLGDKIEREVGALHEAAPASAANIVMYEFLRTAVTFAADLIKDDAEKEGYETEGYEILSSPVFSYVPEPKFLREAARVDAQTAKKALGPLFERLNAQKINVAFDGNIVKPKATVAFIMPWRKKKGKKR
ncbi:MAG: hypothetical protein LBR90_01770 [Elusimicrobiota bacterium]|nr:hypothetical protein [Elusimicrobiota bacterium]